MKHGIFLIFLSFLFLNNIRAQKSSPVVWSFELNKINETDYELAAIATMQKSWVIYSQFTDDGGPIPTSFVINGEEVKFDEKSKVYKEFDDMFEVNVMKFKEKAKFSKIINKNIGKTVSGYVEYMTCDGERCLPPVQSVFELTF